MGLMAPAHHFELRCAVNNGDELLPCSRHERQVFRFEVEGADWLIDVSRSL